MIINEPRWLPFAMLFSFVFKNLSIGILFYSMMNFNLFKIANPGTFRYCKANALIVKPLNFIPIVIAHNHIYVHADAGKPHTQ